YNRLHTPTSPPEPFKTRARITDLIANGTPASDVGLPPIGKEHDRFMLCGSVQMLADLRTLFEGAGLSEGSTTVPGGLVVEKAFRGWASGPDGLEPEDVVAPRSEVDVEARIAHAVAVAQIDLASHHIDQAELDAGQTVKGQPQAALPLVVRIVDDDDEEATAPPI